MLLPPAQRTSRPKGCKGAGRASIHAPSWGGAVPGAAPAPPPAAQPPALAAAPWLEGGRAASAATLLTAGDRMSSSLGRFRAEGSAAGAGAAAGGCCAFAAYWARGNADPRAMLSSAQDTKRMKYPGAVDCAKATILSPAPSSTRQTASSASSADAELAVLTVAPAATSRCCRSECLCTRAGR